LETRKKQTQYLKGQNQGKVSYSKGLGGNMAVFGSTKTKPIQSESPGFARKHEARNTKSERGAHDRAQFEETKPVDYRSVFCVQRTADRTNKAKGPELVEKRRGIWTDFEKTKPICAGRNYRKVFCERGLGQYPGPRTAEEQSQRKPSGLAETSALQI
jgi:hypothetical protein